MQSELSVNYVVRYPGFISSLNTVYTTLWIPMLSILVNDSNDPMCSIQSRVATLTTKSESECGINSIIAEANKVFSPEGFICLLVGIYMNCGDATINKTISNYFERALALSLAFMFEITRNNNRMISVNGDVNDAQQSVTDSPSKQNTELKSLDSVESLIAEKRGITFKVLPLLEAIAAISLPFYGGTTFGFYLSQNDQRVHFVRQKLVSFNSLLSQLVQINLNNNLVTEKCSVAVTEKKDTAIKLAKDGVSDTNTINIDFDQCTTTLRVLDPKIMPMLSTDSMNTMKRLLKSLSALLESRVSNKVD